MTSAETALATGLVARTRPIEAPVDLLAALGADGVAWVHDGAGFVTAGIADRVAPAAVAGVLGAIATDDTVRRPGTGPIAVGALPFRHLAAATLVVPARVTGVATDGTAWVTEIGPEARDGAVRTASTGIEHRAPSPGVDRAAWTAAVTRVLRAISEGDLEKVVLAREITVDAAHAFEPRSVLARLRETGGRYLYADCTRPGGAVVGASPELLVRRTGRVAVSQPLAGTIRRDPARAGDDPGAELLASDKDSREHRITVAAVAQVLAAEGGTVEAREGPDLATLPTMVHLESTVTAHFAAGAPSALDLALSLHPTPAVGGTPRAAALAAIAAIEDFDRGCYAGPVGWVDVHGDGEWAVALRGAELHGRRARVIAGAGIVAGSDPDAEWDEVDAKLEPTLDLLMSG